MPRRISRVERFDEANLCKSVASSFGMVLLYSRKTVTQHHSIQQCSRYADAFQSCYPPYQYATILISQTQCGKLKSALNTQRHVHLFLDIRNACRPRQRCVSSPSISKDGEGLVICSAALRILSTATPPRTLRSDQAAACFGAVQRLLSRGADQPQVRMECTAALVNFVDASQTEDLQVLG